MVAANWPRPVTLIPEITGGVVSPGGGVGVAVGLGVGVGVGLIGVANCWLAEIARLPAASLDLTL